MLEAGLDQAAGLRRLFVRPRLQLVPIVGAARTDAVALASELGQALAGTGRRTLLLDADRGLAGPALGLRTRFDLLHVLAGECELEDAVVAAPGGFHVLPAARGLSAYAREGGDPARLFGALAATRPGFDVALFSASPELVTELLTERGHEVVVVAAATPDGVTSAYARIKQLVQSGFRVFRVAFTGVSGRDRGEHLFYRLASTARRFLGASLVYAGGLRLPGLGAITPVRADAQEPDASNRLRVELERLVAGLDEWQTPAFPVLESSVH